MSSSRVYIGGLAYEAREEDIEYLLRKYGGLRKISLKRGFAFVDFVDHRDAEDACYDLYGLNFMGHRIVVQMARGTPHGRDNIHWSNGDARVDTRRNFSSNFRYSRDGMRNRPDIQNTDSWRRDSAREDLQSGHGSAFRFSSGERSFRAHGQNRYGPPPRTDNRLIVKNLSSHVSWQDLKDYMRKAGDVIYADAHKTAYNEGVVEFADYKGMQNAIYMFDNTELQGRRIQLIEEPNGRYRDQKRHRTRSRSRSRERKRRSDDTTYGRDLNDNLNDKDVRVIESWLSSADPNVKQEVKVKAEPIYDDRDHDTTIRYHDKERDKRDVNQNYIKNEYDEKFDSYYND